VAGIVLTETLHRSPACLPLHTHVSPYFCLVLRGSFEERASGSVSPACAGEILFHPAGETHSDDIRSPGTLLLNIALEDSWNGLLASSDGRARPRPGRQGVSVARVARRIAREMSARDPVASLAIEGLVLTLLTEAGLSRRDRSGAPGWLPVAREYIRAHFRDPFDHAALARIAGVHATHLARAFRAHMGCTVTAYVHHLRVEWAGQRIARADRPLAEVALEAGFSDQAHFTRVFHRVTGCTPAEYRRRSRRRRVLLDRPR
jgi:AraC family transcriptional regulator